MPTPLRWPTPGSGCAGPRAGSEGVDRDQRAGVRRLDVALAELGAEALQQPDLLLGQFERALGGGLLQA